MSGTGEWPWDGTYDAGQRPPFEEQAGDKTLDEDNTHDFGPGFVDGLRRAAHAIRNDGDGADFAEPQAPAAAHIPTVDAPLRMALFSGERRLLRRAGVAVLAVGTLCVAGLMAAKTQETGGSSSGQPSAESSTTFLPTSTKRLQVASAPSSSLETSTSTTLPETTTDTQKPEEDDPAETSTTAASTPKTRVAPTSSAPPSRPASTTPATVRPAPKPTPTAAPPPPPPKPQPTPAPTQPGVTRH